MSHFIKKCKECDKIISQCRCMDKNKEVRYSICNNCTHKDCISKEDVEKFSKWIKNQMVVSAEVCELNLIYLPHQEFITRLTKLLSKPKEDKE